MDEDLLARKGIEPSKANKGFVDDYRLRIGERATLVRRPGCRAYGVMMDIAPEEITALYEDESVADYRPETVLVSLMDGALVEATCYNLPGDKVTGTNVEYAKALLDIAARLGFPDSYLDQIRSNR